MREIEKVRKKMVKSYCVFDEFTRNIVSGVTPEATDGVLVVGS